MEEEESEAKLLFWKTLLLTFFKLLNNWRTNFWHDIKIQFYTFSVPPSAGSEFSALIYHAN